MHQRPIADGTGQFTLNCLRSVRHTTVHSKLSPICAEMVNSRHLPTVVTDDQPFFIHRDGEDHWYANDNLDHSKFDYQSAIQDAGERARLGRLGLVTSFSHVLSIVMPSGPGITVYEIFHETNIHIPLNVYLDWMMLCLRGDLVINLKGVETSFCEGDVIGTLAWEDFTARPTNPVKADELPPQILLMGANRPNKTISTPKRQTISGTDAP